MISDIIWLLLWMAGVILTIQGLRIEKDEASEATRCFLMAIILYAASIIVSYIKC